MIELAISGSDQVALIDDAYAYLVGYKWRLDKAGYVMRKSKGRRIYLHHVVMPDDRWPEYHRDHVNRNKLDNRSCNLRWLTAAESQQNKSAYRCNEVGCRGIRFDQRRGQYLARIQMSGRAAVRRWFSDLDQANTFLISQRRRLMPLSYEAA